MGQSGEFELPEAMLIARLLPEHTVAAYCALLMHRLLLTLMASP